MRKTLRVIWVVILVMIVSVAIKAQNEIGIKSDSWKKIDLPKFLFYIPRDMEEIKVNGIDSQVWQYESKSIFLSIDFGEYSVFNGGLRENQDYQEKSLLIDDEKALMVFYRTKEPIYEIYDYASEVYFSFKNKKTRLSFKVLSKSTDGQEIAGTIFKSIVFK